VALVQNAFHFELEPSFKPGYAVLGIARAAFMGALKLGFKARQEDACFSVVLDLGLVCPFAEKAMDQFGG
jgi:hypothetical protein